MLNRLKHGGVDCGREGLLDDRKAESAKVLSPSGGKLVAAMTVAAFSKDEAVDAPSEKAMASLKFGAIVGIWL